MASTLVLIVSLELISVTIPVGRLENCGLQTWTAFYIQLTGGSKNCKKIKMLVHKKYLTGTGIETISTNSCVWTQTNASPEYLPCDFY